MAMFGSPSQPIAPEKTLPGRVTPMEAPGRHAVLGTPMTAPYPDGIKTIQLGLGCFWGAERLFWQIDGVFTTAVGYGGGQTPNPTYQEVCSGHTNHTELVIVAWDPARISLGQILQVFWEAHNPTQGMRQGNDVGTQYRSAIYWSDPTDGQEAQQSLKQYQEALTSKGLGRVTTEVESAGPFYYAEGYHQQYLHKNPHGYCGLAGTGVSCPIGGQPSP